MTHLRTGAEILIVGAGPAGCSAAFHLAGLGVDVLVVDRARFPRDKACGEYLSPEASRILEAMGALAAVEAAGAAQLAGMIVRAPSGECIRGEFAAGHGFRGFRDRGLALRRRELDAILLRRARAAGARVHEGVRVTDLERDSDGRVVGVRVTDPRGTRTLYAKLVVGADGLHSVISHRVGVARNRRWPRRVAIVAHYRGVREIGAFGEMHVDAGGYVGLADVGGGVSNVAVVVPKSGAREIAGDPAAFLDRWVAARPHLTRRFADAERVSPALATGPFASAVRRAWAPGAALVGDAADFFDPFTGEGIYAALRGGELLAPFAVEAARAADPRTADVALARYERARRAEFGGKWLVERMVGAAVASPFLMNRAARALSARRDMADLLVGVAGDFVPPREVLRPSYLLRLLIGAIAPRSEEEGVNAEEEIGTSESLDALAPNS